MKKIYYQPKTVQYRIEGSELMMSVSTGTDVNIIADKDGEGDASEALVKPFDQTDWEW